MKKIIAVFLAVMLLSACGEKLPEYSEPSEDISVNDNSTDYSQAAHDRLENDTSLPEDESLSQGEATSDAADVSEEISASVSDDISEQESSEDESEHIDVSANVSEEISDELIEESEEETSDIVLPPAVKERIILITADVGYADGTSATLVCGADGTVDLYFGNGVAFEDMEQHEDILQQASILVELGKTYYSKGEKQTEFPFPESGNTYVYIKTENAVYRIAYDNTVTGEGYLLEFERAIASTILAITMKAEQ